jgi:DNA-binding transcriptional LysR family regulator
MELHQLRYVMSVAKHRHFSRAAEESCVSQPTLSQQIIKLEKELGVQLFERKIRSVRPTTAGEAVVFHAKRILKEIEQINESAKEYTSLLKGDVKIGILGIMGKIGLINYIDAFHKRYPGIYLHLLEVGFQDCVKLLRTSEIDVAFVLPLSTKLSDPSIALHPLIMGRVMVLVPHGHPLAHKNDIAVVDLSRENFISWPENQSMHHVLIGVCRASGFEPNIVCECSQVETVVDLVSMGFGITLVSSQLMAVFSRRDVVAVPLIPYIERTVCLVWAEARHQLPAMAAFCDFFKSSFDISITERRGGESLTDIETG